MVVPLQKPGRSRQNYQTPKDFIEAVKVRYQLSGFSMDLAAEAWNAQAPRFFTEKDDALRRVWPYEGDLWLNPPYAQIEPWAQACANYAGIGRIFFLVPASVGANWFASHVWNRARVIFLQGRLSFDGKAPYPKDCMLCVYGDGTGVEVWDWRRDHVA